MHKTRAEQAVIIILRYLLRIFITLVALLNQLMLQLTQALLSFGIAELSGLLIPFYGLSVILGYADALFIGQSQAVLGLVGAQLGGPFVVFDCLSVVGLDALSVFIAEG